MYKYYCNRTVYIITSSNVCLNITENTVYNMLYITLHNCIHLHSHIYINFIHMMYIWGDSYSPIIYSVNFCDYVILIFFFFEISSYRKFIYMVICLYETFKLFNE